MIYEKGKDSCTSPRIVQVSSSRLSSVVGCELFLTYSACFLPCLMKAEPNVYVADQVEPRSIENDGP